MQTIKSKPISYCTCIVVLLLFAFSTSVMAQRKDIHHMMYETFKNSAMCFRTLNGTNQFGCSTTQSGSTGVVHFVNNQNDLQWLLQSSRAGPYMAIVKSNMFLKDVMLQLRDSQRVSGVLLALNGTADRPLHMSPDDTCPNRHSSLTDSCDEESPWNPLGTGFLQIDWTIPLFVVKDPMVIQQIYVCFEKFNKPVDEGQVAQSLCSLQMTAHMYAAVDTPTCLRRNSIGSSYNPITYCDPMGDQNLISQLFPRAAAPNESVVLVTARLDAATMFDGLAPGAVSAVSGIATLLTTAHLLSQLLPRRKETYSKNVIFALLNGESHDYIGSSRVVFDMKQGKFPSADLPLHLDQLDQLIDLHQLGSNRNLHCHCLNSASAQKTVDLLLKSGKVFNVDVEGSCDGSSSKLPPSSLHSFLKANKSLSGIIVTNHANAYTNKFYQGLLDDSINFNFTYANGSSIADSSVQTSLAAISHSLALTLAQMVDPSVTWPSNLSLENTSALVDDLLHCYLESRQCALFSRVAGSAVVGEGEGPLPLYVGVQRTSNQATSVTYLTLAYLTGKPTNSTSPEQCSTTKGDYSYVWVSGDQPDKGICMETGLIYTPAVSPAFTIDNYDWTSGEYSSWTESVWPELSLRMFLRPSFSQELHTLLCGLVVLFISFVSVYWLNKNSDLLFNPLTSETESQNDTTILLNEQAPAMYGCVLSQFTFIMSLAVSTRASLRDFVETKRQTGRVGPVALGKPGNGDGRGHTLVFLHFQVSKRRSLEEEHNIAEAIK